MAAPVGYLLDTNVLLALIRGNDLGEVIDQRFSLRSSLNRSMISVVTVGEMYSLASQFVWGQAKRDALQLLLDEIVWVDINHPDILDAYGRLDYASYGQGKTMGKNDIWIAATARVTQTTLLTTDKDFDHLHVANLINLIWIDPDTKT